MDQPKRLDWISPHSLGTRCVSVLFVVALLPPAILYGCTEDLPQGVYKISVTNEDNVTQWCLDRDRFDPNHVKLVFSACLHPESQRFKLVDPGNAQGCYQIRPLAESSGNDYHVLAVITGAGNPHDGDWTPIRSSPCSSFHGNCSQNFQTWTIHRIENGSYEIKSNVPVEGAQYGYCMDKRTDDTGEGAPEPQFLDCRKWRNQQFWFVADAPQHTDLVPETRPSGYVCQAGKTWVCKESVAKRSPKTKGTERK
jgi:hypothetical protein